jgi:hypothetical protein
MFRLVLRYSSRDLQTHVQAAIHHTFRDTPPSVYEARGATEAQYGVQVRYKSFDCKADVASLLALCCLLAPR